MSLELMTITTIIAITTIMTITIIMINSISYDTSWYIFKSISYSQKNYCISKNKCDAIKCKVC